VKTPSPRNGTAAFSQRMALSISAVSETRWTGFTNWKRQVRNQRMREWRNDRVTSNEQFGRYFEEFPQHFFFSSKKIYPGAEIGKE
jgi:hypothetical protein